MCITYLLGFIFFTSFCNCEMGVKEELGVFDCQSGNSGYFDSRIGYEPCNYPLLLAHMSDNIFANNAYEG